MDNQLYLSDEDLKKIQVRFNECETCKTIIDPDTEKCIFCGKTECWNCKLRCMYEHHRKEVKE